VRQSKRHLPGTLYTTLTIPTEEAPRSVACTTHNNTRPPSALFPTEVIFVIPPTVCLEEVTIALLSSARNYPFRSKGAQCHIKVSPCRKAEGFRLRDYVQTLSVLDRVWRICSRNGTSLLFKTTWPRNARAAAAWEARRRVNQRSEEPPTPMCWHSNGVVGRLLTFRARCSTHFLLWE
jgi:hypothetical protein